MNVGQRCVSWARCTTAPNSATDGVGVLESRDGAIVAFRTYYETAAFLAAGKRNAASQRA